MFWPTWQHNPIHSSGRVNDHIISSEMVIILSSNLQLQDSQRKMSVLMFKGILLLLRIFLRTTILILTLFLEVLQIVLLRSHFSLQKQLLLTMQVWRMVFSEFLCTMKYLRVRSQDRLQSMHPTRKVESRSFFETKTTQDTLDSTMTLGLAKKRLYWLLLK